MKVEKWVSNVMICKRHCLKHFVVPQANTDHGLSITNTTLGGENSMPLLLQEH